MRRTMGRILNDKCFTLQNKVQLIFIVKTKQTKEKTKKKRKQLSKT